MCKGNNTTTSNTSSGPPPEVMQQYMAVLQRANAAANTPYQQYTGPRVAGFSGDQNAAFQTIRDTQGKYLDPAADMARRGSAQIGEGDISRYTNPYQRDVIGATMANINETNAQQRQGVVGNAISSGAWGGDRAGVAQAELARQQSLASNQTLAGLNSQNYSQALGAAQADRAAAGQGAYTMAGLQNTALQGAGAQLQAGGLQQQLGQAGMNVDYGNFKEQRAYPFQLAQWLAGISSGIGSNTGGNSTTNTTPPPPNPWNTAMGMGMTALPFFLNRGGRVTGTFAGGGLVPYSSDDYIPTIDLTRGLGPPKPPTIASSQSSAQTDPLQVGMANLAKGLSSRRGSESGGEYRAPAGFSAGVGEEGPSLIPNGMVGEFGPMLGMRRGGLVNPRLDSMADSAVHLARKMRGGLVMPDPNGIYLPQGYAGAARHIRQVLHGLGADKLRQAFEDRRAVDFDGEDQSLQFRDAVDATRRAWSEGEYDASGTYRGPIRGYAEGGVPSFDDRYAPVREAIADGTFDPQGANSIAADDRRLAGLVAGLAARQPLSEMTDFGGQRVAPDAVPLPRPRPAGVMVAEEPAAETPRGLAPRLQPSYTERGPLYAEPQAGLAPRAPVQSGEAEPRRNFLGLPALSDEAKLGLMKAGLGMMASKSPFLGQAIGEGGLAGVESYQAAKKTKSDEAYRQETLGIQKQTAAQGAQRLAQQAEQFAKSLQLQTDQFGLQRDKATMAPEGFRKTERGLEFIPGGPQDPVLVGAQTRAKTADQLPQGYRRASDGSLEIIPGGPQDPAIIGRQARARVQTPEGYRETGTGVLEAVPGGPQDPATVAAQAKAKNEGKEKPIPSSLQKQLGDKAATYHQLNSLNDQFKDNYAGAIFPVAGDLQNWAGRQMGLGYKDQADWWQQYAANKNVIRHALFGSALTKGETASFEKQDINPGMQPELIRKNLARQRDIIEGALKRRAGSLAKQGYNKDAIETEMGITFDSAKAAGLPQQRPITTPAPAAAPRAVNPTTGQTLILQDGKWVPVQ